MKNISFVLSCATLALFMMAFVPSAVRADNVTVNTAAHVAPELQSADALFGALNARAAMMRDVALVKWRNGQPIEDLRREEQVVQKAKTAATREGLTNVTATSRAQIRIAKLIQQRWHERWAREGLAGNEYSIPLNALRTRLDALDEKFLATLNEALPSLRDSALQPRLKTLFLRRFTTGDLRNEERLSLFRALLQVRLASHTK